VSERSVRAVACWLRGAMVARSTNALSGVLAVGDFGESGLVSFSLRWSFLTLEF